MTEDQLEKEALEWLGGHGDRYLREMQDSGILVAGEPA